MWVLDSDGDALRGKRLWLPPGKKFLFGRTQSDAGQVVISDKTISRKHLTVEVSSVGPADCTNPRSRSRITLEDLNTKIGTLVNEEQIRGRSCELKDDRNTVTLGRYRHSFTFSWVPVTFTFSFTAKEARADPYTPLYDLLGPLDIKVLVDYVRGQTTHVVAKKRNTSKGLQALLDGKYIVHNDSYINAILAATTVMATTEENDTSKALAQSLLELDWDENFPDPLKYLPPRGDEPTQRDSSAYSPNNIRQDLFDGYIFIFYEKRQFETLLAPITDGRGKALLRDVVPGRTEINDFVGYVKSVAGEKGLGKFEDGSEGKGVVVVRFNPVKCAGSEWFSEFNRKVSLYLDHRLIEQNEFLDAILGNDASMLRKSLELEASGVVAPPSTVDITVSQAPQSALSTPAPPIPGPSQPARRGRSRRTVATRFKGFDSDDEIPTNMNSIPENMAVNAPTVVELQSQSLFVTQDPDMDIDRAPSLQLETQTRSTKKRNSPPVNYDSDNDADIMEEMAPAATAWKRRRLADETARRRGSESRPLPPVPKETPAPKVQPVKKVEKEVDVVDVARKQREQAEELARTEREALEVELEGMDIEAIRNLVIVEEMEVRRSDPPQRPIRADESDRWDDRWNGKKNFKRFRHRGAVGGRREPGRVIIPLEEAKKKEYGIGDDYWLQGDSYNRKKKDKGRSRDTQDFTQTGSQPSRSKSHAPTTAAEILAREATDNLLDVGIHVNSLSSLDVDVVEAPPKTASTSRSLKSQKLVDKSSKSSNLLPRNKRPASTTLAEPTPVKKAKLAAVEIGESDDSDDELKFRFRKRK